MLPHASHRHVVSAAPLTQRVPDGSHAQCLGTAHGVLSNPTFDVLSSWYADQCEAGAGGVQLVADGPLAGTSEDAPGCAGTGDAQDPGRPSEHDQRNRLSVSDRRTSDARRGKRRRVALPVPEHGTVRAPPDARAAGESAVGRRPICIIVRDMESFDARVLRYLIHGVSTYGAELPTVLVLGIATGVETVHRMLSRDIVALLRTERFRLQPASACLADVIDRCMISGSLDPTSTFALGQEASAAALDCFLCYNFSLKLYARYVQYAIFDHFWQQPLSVFSASDGETLYDHAFHAPQVGCAAREACDRARPAPFRWRTAYRSVLRARFEACRRSGA